MKITEVFVRRLVAAVFAIMSLFVGVAPAVAESPVADPPPECSIYVAYSVAEGGEAEPCEVSDGQLREAFSGALLRALESYGSAYGTYRIPDSGFDGRGTGWAVYEGSRYPTSIASVLNDEGFFSGDLEQNHYWDRTTALATTEGIVAVYRCKDRVAVFNFHSDRQASQEDSDWWTDNDCFRYPIDTRGATDYTISRHLGDLEGASVHEDLRVTAANAVLDALNRYYLDNGTHKVPDSGFDGGGTGWAFWEGNRYTTSIASVLIAEGYLDPDPEHDPLWANTKALAATEGAVLVYRCNGKAAVFVKHSTATPYTSDSNWWTGNDCTDYPIDAIGATYYQVTWAEKDPDCDDCVLLSIYVAY